MNALGFVVLDGGFATQLEAYGANLKDHLWSAKLLIENPELIQKVHEDYIRAGADIICTATYQASFQAFKERGILELEAKKLFETGYPPFTNDLNDSVHLARSAINTVWPSMEDSIDEGGVSYSKQQKRYKPLIAASLGPYGSFEGSEFKGNYGKSIQELMDFHKPRMMAVLSGEPDLLLMETVPCGNEEAAAIATLLKTDAELHNVPTIVSFSCKDGEHTCCGEEITEAVKHFSDIDHVIAIGVNCTNPKFATDLVSKIKSVTNKVIAVYPNSGETWNAETYTWNEDATAKISNKTEEWFSAGARVFGGCCRTTPEDIKSVRKVLESVCRK